MAQNQLETFVSAARRMGGASGSAWVDGVMQTDVIEVGAGLDMGRADVLLVGQRRIGHKMTRITPDGTLRTQKIDARWELFVYNMTSMGEEERIAARDRGDYAAADPTFSLKLVINDPQAYGREAWQLDGCRIWRFQLGSAQSDDVIEREYPLTWESERPLDAYEIHPGGIKVVKYHST